MDLPQQLHLIGVNHRGTASGPVAALGLTAEEVAVVLEGVGERPDVGLLLLATCSRTEFYFTGIDRAEGADLIDGVVRSLRPGVPRLRSVSDRCELDGSPVAAHLFRVVSGLDSPILGDSGIIPQLRQALVLAETADTLTPPLRELGRRAMAFGRRVRAESSISDGDAGIGSAVARVVSSHVVAGREIGRARAVVIGAGQAARDVARQLDQSGVGHIDVLNRDLGRARSISDIVDGTARPLDELEAAVLEADIIVAAVSGTGIILPTRLLDEARRRRPTLLVVDVSFPAVTAPGPAGTIFFLNQLEDRHPAERIAAVPAVEQMCAEEVGDWVDWLRAKPLELEISSLFREVDDVLARLSTSLPVGDSHHRNLEQSVRRELKATLHRHVTRLRASRFVPAIAADVSDDVAADITEIDDPRLDTIMIGARREGTHC